MARKRAAYYVSPIVRIETFVPVLLLLGGGYVALTGMMYLLQNRLVFQPTARIFGTPADVGLAYEDVQLGTSDGEALHGWWIPHDAPRATVLFLHGNAGNISGRLETLRVLHDLQLNVLIFDYRGYGQSTGSPSEQGLCIDAETAWDYLTGQRGIAPSEIVLHGRSLGSGPATWLAERVSEGAVILESAFTSIPDVGAHHYPYLPVRLLSKVRFDNVPLVSRCGSPLLVIHSPQDDVIPYEHGRRLFEAAREPKTMLDLSGSHNAAFLGSLPRYVPAVDAFLTEHVDGASDPP